MKKFGLFLEETTKAKPLSDNMGEALTYLKDGYFIRFSNRETPFETIGGGQSYMISNETPAGHYGFSLSPSHKHENWIRFSLENNGRIMLGGVTIPRIFRNRDYVHIFKLKPSCKVFQLNESESTFSAKDLKLKLLKYVHERAGKTGKFTWSEIESIWNRLHKIAKRVGYKRLGEILEHYDQLTNNPYNFSEFLKDKIVTMRDGKKTHQDFLDEMGVGANEFLTFDELSKVADAPIMRHIFLYFDHMQPKKVSNISSYITVFQTLERLGFYAEEKAKALSGFFKKLGYGAIFDTAQPKSILFAGDEYDQIVVFDKKDIEQVAVYINDKFK